LARCQHEHPDASRDGGPSLTEGKRPGVGVDVGVGTSDVRQCACDMVAKRYYGDLDDALHLAM